MATPTIGDRLGHFELTGELGVGGMGTVLRALDTRLGRSVAIKLLLEDMSRQEDLRSRFEREARILGSLNHPNICALYGFEVDRGLPYLVMELVEGDSLGQRLAAGPLRGEEAIGVARQIGAALQEAHRAGIVHRDLKPSNVMITRQGTVKVLDFGIAKYVGLSAPEGATALTKTGTLVGTVGYMSPEQIREQPIGSASDIWSFGCLLFEIYSGAKAFQRETLGDTLAAILELEPNWAVLPADTPPAVTALTRRCLTRSVEERLQAIGEAVEEFDKLGSTMQATTFEVAGSVGDACALAEDAIGRNSWQEAFDLLNPIRDTLESDDLSRLARAAWWIGDMDIAMEADERAYNGYVSMGDGIGAASAAVQMADHHSRRLNSSLCNGWMARASRHLANQPDSPAHGWLLRLQIKKALEKGDFDAALGGAKRMLEVANATQDIDLQTVAIHYEGMSRFKQGHVEEGMALIDEAAVVAVSGELSPIATAFIYCNALSACRAIGDYRRAGEWTEAAKRWCERQSISGFPGVCRVVRAEVLRLYGQWSEAEDEALRACNELEDFSPNIARAAFHELGEIRLRIGEYDAAEAAFAKAQTLGRDPQPGLVLLLLARGDTVAAESSIRNALERQTQDPFVRARLLPARVEIAAAMGDAEAALQAANELENLRATLGSAAVSAAAEQARGTVCLLEERFGEA